MTFCNAARVQGCDTAGNKTPRGVMLAHGSHQGQPIARGADFTANGVYDR